MLKPHKLADPKKLSAKEIFGSTALSRSHSHWPEKVEKPVPEDTDSLEESTFDLKTSQRCPRESFLEVGKSIGNFGFVF